MHASDPWAGVRSVRGHHVDELVSTVQKSIRRGLRDQALLAARELFETGPDTEDLLWIRLGTVSAEDCGGLLEPVAVHALDELRRRDGRLEHDRWLLAVHAIRLLLESAKDRTSDELANLVAHRLRTDPGLLTIPDYALDVHTVRGREAGVGTADFWRTGSLVQNERDGRDQSAREEILALIENGEWPA